MAWRLVVVALSFHSPFGSPINVEGRQRTTKPNQEPFLVGFQLSSKDCRNLHHSRDWPLLSVEDAFNGTRSATCASKVHDVGGLRCFEFERVSSKVQPPWVFGHQSSRV